MTLVKISLYSILKNCVIEIINTVTGVVNDPQVIMLIMLKYITFKHSNHYAKKATTLYQHKGHETIDNLKDP